MVTTKYSPINISLLLLGVLLAVVDAWLAAMTSAFGTDPVHNVRSGAIVVMLIASATLLPVSLVTVWWPTLGAGISWVIAVLCAACVLFSSAAILFLILAVVEALNRDYRQESQRRTLRMTANPEMILRRS